MADGKASDADFIKTSEKVDDVILFCPLHNNVIHPAALIRSVVTTWCDTHSLKVVAPGKEGKLVSFVADARLRGRDEPLAPTRLLGHLKSHDLVIETLSGARGEGIGRRAAVSMKDGHATLASPKHTDPPEITIVDIFATWRPQCGMAEHKSLTFVPPVTTKSEFAPKAGPHQKTHVYSEPLPGWQSPIALLKALFDHEAMIAEYQWRVVSCETPPSGAAIGDLSALVRAHPKDIIGVKISIAPKSGKAVWDNTEVGEERDRARDLKKSLAEIKDPKQPGKSASKGAFRRWKNVERPAVNRRRDEARTAIREHDKASARTLGFKVNSDVEVEANLIVNDREFEYSELKAISELWGKIDRLTDEIGNIVSFLKSMNPSPFQPKVSLEIKLLNGEITIASGYYVNRTSGRFQTVEREFYINLQLILIAFEGILGVSVGGIILGTGLEGSAAVTPKGKIGLSVDAVFSDPFHFKAYLKGELTCAAVADVRASFLYREIAAKSWEIEVKLILSKDLQYERGKSIKIDYKIPPMTYTTIYRNSLTEENETHITELSKEIDGEVSFGE